MGSCQDRVRARGLTGQAGAVETDVTLLDHVLQDLPVPRPERDGESLPVRSPLNDLRYAVDVSLHEVTSHPRVALARTLETDLVTLPQLAEARPSQRLGSHPEHGVRRRERGHGQAGPVHTYAIPYGAIYEHRLRLDRQVSAGLRLGQPRHSYRVWIRSAEHDGIEEESGSTSQVLYKAREHYISESGGVSKQLDLCRPTTQAAAAAASASASESENG